MFLYRGKERDEIKSSIKALKYQSKMFTLTDEERDKLESLKKDLLKREPSPETIANTYTRQRLAEERNRKIMDLFYTGRYTLNEISEHFNVSHTTVSRIISKKLPTVSTGT